MWFTVNIRRSFLDQNKHDMMLTPANLTLKVSAPLLKLTDL